MPEPTVNLLSARAARPRVLLVNPAIYDFSAYDFWSRPYGLLAVAGQLRGQADMTLFDYLDRRQQRSSRRLRADQWGRGEYAWQEMPKPSPLRHLPRRWRRFGRSREEFRRTLQQQGPFDFVLVQSMMTYWYLGVDEVIQDVRQACPTARVVVGGVYATLCPRHAQSLGPDLVIRGRDIQPLWNAMGIEGQAAQPPLWEAYRQSAEQAAKNSDVGVMKLSDGCPFHCTYCGVHRMHDGFAPKPLDRAIRELDLLLAAGAKHIAFYDDALLYQPQPALAPLLKQAAASESPPAFHTPNALNARFVTAETARMLVAGGFKTFYLGLESNEDAWQRQTGGKVQPREFASAVGQLRSAGAAADSITAYVIIGHPRSDRQRVEETMQFAHRLGTRIMLAEFSPVPGTPDGDACAKHIDLSEPLWHNKTAYAITALGEAEVNRLKSCSREWNARLSTGSAWATS